MMDNTSVEWANAHQAQVKTDQAHEDWRPLDRVTIGPGNG